MREVPTSVMPKGVEHLQNGQASISNQGVPTSVMPKGVEHMRADAMQAEFQASADLCDAERR